MSECDKLLRDIDKLMNANTIKFMEAVYTALHSIYVAMQDLDKRLEVIEGANRSPKGAEGEDAGTRGGK